MTPTDLWYREMLLWVTSYGDRVEGRNGPTLSAIDIAPACFTETPLVTVRKTAWRRALLEMEWFLSGEEKCPEELADTWWKGQLDARGHYIAGYGAQLRWSNRRFDQVEYLVQGLRRHPNSRRLVLTTWNPCDMARITVLNDNPRTPTTCHTTVAQFFVRGNALHATSYQRSADLLLGVPHNWIQSWALLLWLAHRTGRQPGSLRWLFGDAHIYQEASHVEAARAIIETPAWPKPGYRSVRSESPLCALVYNPDNDAQFFARHFSMVGEIPEPLVTIQPRLL